MLALLRRDPLMEMSSVTRLVIASFAAYLVETARAALAAAWPATTQMEHLALVLVAAAMWIPLTIFLMVSKAHQRCRVFDLSLPIAARGLWLAHVVAVVVVALGSLCSASLLVLFQYHEISGALADEHNKIFLPSPPLVRLAVPLIAGVIVSTILLQRESVSLCHLPRRWRYAAVPALQAVVFLLVVLLSALPLPVALLVLLPAFWLAYRTYLSIPAAFEWPASEPAAAGAVATVGPDGADRAQSAGDWFSRSRGGVRSKLAFLWLVMRIISRTVCLKQRTPIVLGYLILVFWGLMLPWTVARPEEVNFSYLTLNVYFLFAFAMAPLAQLYRLDAFPISRRQLCAFLIFPPILALALGYGAGQLISSQWGKPAVALEYRPAPSVFVPAEYWRIARDGHAPSSVAPWGESHEPWTMPLFKGSRIVIYSPFSSTTDASSRYVAWQISRAIETVYGKSVAPEEIQRRCFPGARGFGGAERRLAQFLAGLPGLKRAERLALFPAYMAATSLLWFVILGAYLRAFRAKLPDRFRKYASFGIMALLFAAAWPRLVIPNGANSFSRIILHQAIQILPGGDIALWVICVLLFAGGYELLQGQFERIELMIPRESR